PREDEGQQARERGLVPPCVGRHRRPVRAVFADRREEGLEAPGERRRLGQEPAHGRVVEEAVAVQAPGPVAELEGLAQQRLALGAGAAPVLLSPDDKRPRVGDGRLQLRDAGLVHCPGSYNGAGGLLRDPPSMPTGRSRARRTTIREVLDAAIELEKKTMALYVGF